MTKVGVLGTGVVGQTLADRLVGLGHEVMMGARQAGNEKATAWAAAAGASASAGTFADAAGFGALIVNATAGTASLDALDAAGAENLAGKAIVDVANPLDFSAGMPPSLSVCNTDSLGEQIQRRFPDARGRQVAQHGQRRRHGAARHRPRPPHHVPVRQRRPGKQQVRSA